MTVRLTFERDMTASVPEFLRGLPAAVAAAFQALGCGDAECRAAAAQAESASPADDTQARHVVIEQSGRRLEMTLTPQPARDIGAMRLPRMRAALNLSGFSESEAGRFLEAFDARFRRGGG